MTSHDDLQAPGFEAARQARVSEGYPPPRPGGTSDDVAAVVRPAQPSKADVAKDQAQGVAGGAADAAQHVAGVAKDQVGQVAKETGRQVKQMVATTTSELADQAGIQQQRAAGGLHALGEQLKAMAAGKAEPGPVTDLAQQAAQKAHEFAGWLENRDPRDVLDEVRVFARRRPVAFLAIALGAGVLTGRLARGMAAGTEQSAVGPTGSGSVMPVPAVARRPISGGDPVPALGPAAQSPVWTPSPAVTGSMANRLGDGL